jgi:hypothetical protein
MIPVILPTDRLRIAAIRLGCWPVPAIRCGYAVKKIEPERDPHRRMCSLRSPEEATRDRNE